MAGDMTIKDWTADNLIPTNFVPFTVVDLDATNSGVLKTGVGPCSGAGGECIGVVYDQPKLDPSGTVVPNSGVTIRTHGIATVIANAAIAAGAFVSVATAAGLVRSQAIAAGGAVPVPIVGRALTQAQAQNDRIKVMLMIGGRV